MCGPLGVLLGDRFHRTVRRVKRGTSAHQGSAADGSDPGGVGVTRQECSRRKTCARLGEIPRKRHGRGVGERFLYSTGSGSVATTEPSGGLCRPGPARRMAAAARDASSGDARAVARDAGGRRPGAGEEARQARPAHDRRPARATRRTATRRPCRSGRIADLMAGEEATIAGEVRRVSVRRPRRNLAIVQARVADESDEITAVWFNQAWLAEKLQPGTRVRLRGAAQARRLPGALVRPERRLGDRRLRARLSGQRGGHAQAAARARRARPPACARRPRSAARRAEGARAAAAARRRARRAAPAALARGGRGGAKAARVRRAARAAGRARACPGRARGARSRRRSAPPASWSSATAACSRSSSRPTRSSAIAEIDRDLAREAPMQRLLQGDVGSGKTVVALYALLRAVEAGYRGALMAPTETLAEQHFLTIEPLCAELGVPVALLTRSVKSDVERGADRRRHARADPGGRRAARPRGRRRRRAAPLRRRAAQGARRGPRAARPAHDRDADPAHARADALRRPAGDRDREAAGRAQADRHERG